LYTRSLKISSSSLPLAFRRVDHQELLMGVGGGIIPAIAVAIASGSTLFTFEVVVSRHFAMFTN
jgi:hypothetical protein